MKIGRLIQTDFGSEPLIKLNRKDILLILDLLAMVGVLVFILIWPWLVHLVEPIINYFLSFDASLNQPIG
jgi:hypothetical protein